MKGKHRRGREGRMKRRGEKNNIRKDRGRGGARSDG